MIKYLMISILISNGNVVVQVEPKPFHLMNDCFVERDMKLQELPKWPAPNFQILCIPATNKALGVIDM